MGPYRTTYLALVLGVVVSGCSAAQLAAEGARLALTAISAAADEPHPATGPQYPKNPTFPVAIPSQTASVQQSEPAAAKYCYDPRIDTAYQAGRDCAAGDREVTEREYRARKAVQAARAVDEHEQSATPAPAPKAVATEQPALAPQMPTAPPQTAAVATLPPTPRQEIAPIPETMTPTGAGSGFFINAEGGVLTNWHVAGECKRVGIVKEGKLIPAALHVGDRDVDLAVIDTNREAAGVAVFRSSPVELGEQVFVFGYPLIDELGSLNMTAGIVSSTAGPGGAPWVLQTNAEVQPGNSGGPMVDHSGRVVGVTIARLKDEAAQNVNFAIKGDVVIGYLKAMNVAVGLGGSGTELSTTRIARKAGAFTVPVICFN